MANRPRKNLMDDLRELAKLILICLFVIGCIGLGLYVGGWFCFIGGICQVVEAIKLTPVDGVQLGIGLLRVSVAAPAGWLTLVLSLGLLSLLSKD